MWPLVQLKSYTGEKKNGKLLLMCTESWGDEKLLKALCIEQEKKLALKSKQEKMK